MRTNNPPTGDDNPPTGDNNRRAAAEEAVSSLGRAVGSLRCAGSQRLVRLGISMTHFHVLTLLCHHDAMPMGRLADVMGVSMSNATGIIDRMEERVLVERSRVPGDRRVVLVRPTQAGHDLVDEAELIKSDLVTNAIGRLADDQLEDLARVINALREAVDAEMAAHAGLQPNAAPCGHPDHGPAAAPSVVPARHPGA